jgi:hypothetical protein
MTVWCAAAACWAGVEQAANASASATRLERGIRAFIAQRDAGRVNTSEPEEWLANTVQTE